MKHKCPVCKKPLLKSAAEQSGREEFFPFCSKRCKLIDLGAWLDAEYRIAAGSNSDETNEQADDDTPSRDAQ